MRFLSALIAALTLATPASACRVGGEDVIVAEAPAPVSTPRHTTIAEVLLTGEKPGPDWKAASVSGRGILVGTAQVRRVLRGPELPTAVPAYLDVVTSCSYFFRGPKARFSILGYVVGRLVVDDGGAHLILTERHDSTGSWR